MRISCYRCGGTGWICETHPDKPCGHDRCEGAALQCPACHANHGRHMAGSPLTAPLQRPRPARDRHTGRFAREPYSSNGLRDSFDYETLWQLLGRIGASHRLITFSDSIANDQGPICILRHDIDYTLYAALALAREEAARGIRATYFVLANSAYFNLLSASHAQVPAALVALGHEVGLHYDVRFFHHFPRDRWDELLDAQAALLERLCGRRIQSIAMHQPALTGDDPFRDTTRYLNAYSARFTEGMTYLSDSCRAWRNDAWRVLAEGPLPERLQLGLHPINWAAEDRPRTAIFRDLHLALANAVLGEGEDLLTKIAAHPAVVEHNARRAVDD
jgi:hypothetical protein